MPKNYQQYFPLVSYMRLQSHDGMIKALPQSRFPAARN